MFLQCGISCEQHLRMFLSLMICRSAHDELQTYSHPQIPATLLSLVYDLRFVNAPAASTARQCLTVRDLVTDMKLNFFESDKISVMIKSLLRDAPSHRTTNTYLLTLCTSLEFVTRLRDTGAFNEEISVVGKLRRVRQVLPIYKWFSLSFNPQRRMHRQYKKLNDETSWTQFLSSITRTPRKIRTKDTHGRKKPK